MFDRIFNDTQYLRSGLDASALRNQVIANNIANAETPGFKSSSVEFETMFRSAIEAQGGFKPKATRDKHRAGSSSIKNVSAAVVQNTSTTMRMDDNNVDIDFQNAELAKNQIYYEALIEKLNSEYARLRMAIREGS